MWKREREKLPKFSVWGPHEGISRLRLKQGFKTRRKRSKVREEISEVEKQSRASPWDMLGIPASREQRQED